MCDALLRDCVAELIIGGMLRIRMIVGTFFTKCIERIWSIHENMGLNMGLNMHGFWWCLVTPRWTPTAWSLAVFCGCWWEWQGGIKETPWNNTMKLHEIPWNTLKYHEIPWNAMNTTEAFKGFVSSPVFLQWRVHSLAPAATQKPACWLAFDFPFESFESLGLVRHKAKTQHGQHGVDGLNWSVF